MQNGPTLPTQQDVTSPVQLTFWIALGSAASCSVKFSTWRASDRDIRLPNTGADASAASTPAFRAFCNAWAYAAGRARARTATTGTTSCANKRANGPTAIASNTGDKMNGVVDDQGSEGLKAMMILLLIDFSCDWGWEQSWGGDWQEDDKIELLGKNYAIAWMEDVAWMEETQ